MWVPLIQRLVAKMGFFSAAIENSSLQIDSKHEPLARTVSPPGPIIPCLGAPSFSLTDGVFRTPSINVKHFQRQQVCICFQPSDIQQLLGLHRCYGSINLDIESGGKQRSVRQLTGITMMGSPIIAILFLISLLAIRLRRRRWLAIVTLVPYSIIPAQATHIIAT